MRAREPTKQGLGWMVSHAVGRYRFSNCIFVLAHMRCGSTALSNILCSRPDISGYGEAHIRYDGRASLGRLAVNHWRHGGLKPRAAYQFDKILHSTYDGDVPSAFFDARAIFVVRRPGDTVRSIVHLYRTLGRREMITHTEAVTYYVRRLAALEALWQGFPPTRRAGLSHLDLLRQPEQELARLSGKLAIVPELRNSYESPAASRRKGGGDPLTSGSYSSIQPKLQDNAGEDGSIDVPDHLLAEAYERYERLRTLFSMA